MSTSTGSPGTRRRKPAAGALPPKRLTSLELGEVSCVDVPANSGARHLLFKNTAAVAADPPDPGQDGAPDAARVTADLLAEHAEQLRDKDEQLAFLAERLAALTPPGSDPAGDAGGGNANPGQDPALMSETKPDVIAAALTKAAADSDTRMAAALAKAAEDNAAAIAKATEDLTKKLEAADKRAEKAEQTAAAEKAARVLVDLTKTAEGPDYGALPGEPLAKAKALAALAALPEDERTVLEAALKAGNAAMGKNFKTVGKSGEGYSGAGNTSANGTAGGLPLLPAEAELEGLAKDLAKTAGISYAAAYPKAVSANPDVYARYNAERAARARQV